MSLNKFLFLNHLVKILNFSIFFWNRYNFLLKLCWFYKKNIKNILKLKNKKISIKLYYTENSDFINFKNGSHIVFFSYMSRKSKNDRWSVMEQAMHAQNGRWRCLFHILELILIATGAFSNDEFLIARRNQCHLKNTYIDVSLWTPESNLRDARKRAILHLILL